MATVTEKIKVLIADDHPILRQGLRQALELSGEIVVIGEASNGRQCVESVRKLRPDVILIDISMPEMNGLEASRIIKQENPSVGIVILTMYDAEDYLIEAVRIGVEGYALKDIDPPMLVDAIRASCEGRSFLHPKLASRLMSGVRRQGSAGESKARDVLSQREVEVLELMAQGVNNREIGERLFISEKTVKNHANSIFRKIDVSDRTQAVLQAIKRGWVQVR